MTDQNQTEIQDDDERDASRQMSLDGSRPPCEIEGYSVTRRLGAGSFGTVWLAREDRTGRMVAIKYYPHRRGLNWSLLNREVEKLAALYSSRNIVRLLDVGWNAEPPYYVMEFVENGSLGEYLISGPLAVDEAARIGQQVCSALVEAHGAGVLHCDLKPDNVLLDAQYQVRLCDFGQSRMSHEQSPALGTLYYMAPEQADLEAVPDARWDVYAVGGLLYHMLTGQPPYRDSTIQKKLEAASSLQERLQIYQRHIRCSPPPDGHHQVRGVDRHLASVIDQCLAVEPVDRLPNAQAILTQLKTRERNRSRRPLLFLGMVGQLVLMCAMVPIFVQAMQSNLRESESQLIEGRQNSNALVALRQADALQDELLFRLDELREMTGQLENASGQIDTAIQNALIELMTRPSDDVVAEVNRFYDRPFEDRPRWMQLLDKAHDETDRRNRANGKSRDTSWFLCDAEGRALWRRQYSERTIGTNFSYRDYFHGLNVEFDPETVPEDIAPIQQAHVSLPFVSRATNRYMVALSVPIRAKGEVIGVFARTLHLDDLQARLGQDLRGQSESFSGLIALADRRDPPQLLDHLWLQSKYEQFENEADAREVFERLQLNADTRQQIQQQLAMDDEGATETVVIRDNDYQDPVGELSEASAQEYNDAWIATIAPMTSDKMPWLVIVQERRNNVVAPIRKMQSGMVRQAVYAVLAAIGIMAAIWLFVWQALARARSPQESLASDVADKGPPARKTNERASSTDENL
ncbi:MAG: serine/threonine protein kinase [Planctomycetaceae bacterium]|nr:serine/threonine protein kinase [Planctomycetaceae bacterium]